MRVIVYPPQDPVFESILGFFAGKRAEVIQDGDLQVADSLPQIPTKDILANLVNTAFWASLLKDEGRTSSFSVVFVTPDRCPHAFRFQSPLPLSPESLAKLSPAV